tara:strand:- start:19941 stop:26531 length:6591 start_codon:yes stop_codon:yes gene_type:complete
MTVFSMARRGVVTIGAAIILALAATPLSSAQVSCADLSALGNTTALYGDDGTGDCSTLAPGDTVPAGLTNGFYIRNFDGPPIVRLDVIEAGGSQYYDPSSTMCSGAGCGTAVGGGGYLCNAPAGGGSCAFTWQYTSPAPGGATITVTGSIADNSSTLSNIVASGGAYAADTTGPRAVQIIRVTPSSSTTNADTVTFGVVFDEHVANASTADFTVVGSSATPISVLVDNSNPAFGFVGVAITGGDLPGLNGTVGLALAASPGLTDLAGNPMTNTALTTGTNETYDFDNTAPTSGTPAIQGSPARSATSLTWRVAFAESVVNVDVTDFTLVKEPGAFTPEPAGAIDSVTDIGMGIFDVNVTGVAGEGGLRMRLNASTDITDAAGNGPPAEATSAQHFVDTIVPSVDTISSFRTYTNDDSLRFDVTFSENVTNVTADDFTVTGGTTATVTNVTGSGSVYELTVSGGDLAGIADTTVDIGFAGGQDIEDNFGNALTNTTPGSSSPVFVNNTPPVGTFSTAAASPVTTTFTVNLAFTPQVGFADNVVGLTQSDITISNGTIDSFTLTNGAGGVVTGADIVVTPLLSGEVTLDLPADVIIDEAENPNPAATQFSITAALPDTTPPPAPTTPDLLASSDSGVSSLDDITNDNTPTFATTVSVDTVEVRFFRDGSTQIGTATPTSTSVEYTSYATLPDGPHTITAVAVDAAGNESAPSTGLSITIDTTVVANTPDLLASFDGGPFDDDNVTNRYSFGNFDFSVAGEEGASVLITESQTGQSRAGEISGGSVVLSLDWDDGTSDVVAEVTDIAGNVATSAPLAVTLEASAPSFAANVTGGSSTTQTTAQVTLSFDVPVFNVDPSDFTITNGATISAVSGSGTSYTLTVTGLTPGFTHELACDANADAQSLGGAVVTDGNFCSPIGAFALITVDTTAPSLVSIARGDPTDEVTTSDTLVWRVEFSENVNLSPSDFSLEGTTATLALESCGGGKGQSSGAGGNPLNGPGTMSRNVGSDDIFCVRASGGDLADLNGTVRLRVASTVTDSAGTTLSSTTPTGAWEDYQVSNLGFAFTDLTLQTPAATPTNADSVTWRINLTNSPGASVTADDFTIIGTTAELSLIQQSFHLEVTASGGDLADLNGTIELGVASGQDMTSIEDVSLSNPDFISTQAARQVVIDNTPPTLTSIEYDSGTESPTAEDTLAFIFTYSEALDPSANAVSNLAVSGTTATASITPISPSVARVVLSGGDLADLNGPVSVSLSESGSIPDAAGNLLVTTTPTETNNNTVQVQNDNSAPTVTITSETTGPVNAAFPVTVRFNEPVTGFTLDDLVIGGAEPSEFAGSGAAYTLTLTPGDAAAVTVNLPAGAAVDAAGNANVAAEAFAITVDAIAPSVTLATTETSRVSGPFELAATFSEEVTGFELDDLVVVGATASDLTGDGPAYTVTLTPDAEVTEITVDIAAAAAVDVAGNESLAADTLTIEVDLTAPAPVLTAPDATVEGAFVLTVDFGEPVTGFDLSDLTATNADLSDLVDAGEGVFTLTVTPQTLGVIELWLAEGAAEDAPGNASQAASLSVEAISRPIEVTVTVDSATADPTDIKGSATITNPGSAEIPFRAFANVSWLSVTPGSGTIPALGEIELTVEVTDAVNDLAPGNYTGTVTVVRDIAAGAASAGSGTAKAAETIIVEIPVAVTLQQRFGTVELVATTPPGVSGEASFAYASDLEAFDGLTLTTSNGRASESAGQTLFGTYALTQSSPPGWRVDSISCAGDLDGGSSFDLDAGIASIDLDPGESLICTVENVRDEDAVRLATQRAIRNFMARRADRIIEAAPNLSRRFDERATNQPGGMGADVDGSGRYQMAFSASLSGLRNAAAVSEGAAQFDNPERPFLDGWDVWLSAEVSGVSDDRAGERAESDFGVAQVGVDYQLGPDLILGGLAQYDWMKESAGEVFEAAGAIRGARVEGKGWMAGPYAVWRIRDNLIFDGLAMYGRSDNVVDPLGLYEDDFETDRFMVRVNLTGEFVAGEWRLRPQAGITHFEETQDAYIDSLGITIPEQTLALGRLRAGPEVAWRREGDHGGWFEVTTAVNAVWDYQAAELLSETGQLTGGAQDVRADARLGLAARTPWGAVIRLETGYAGLGVGDFEARSARFEIRIPFGAAGSGGGSSAIVSNRFADDCGGIHAGFAQMRGASGGCGAGFAGVGPGY